MPWVPHATGPGAFTAFIKGALRSDEEGTEFHRGLFAGDQVVGGCGASVDLVNRVAEMGYWLSSAWEGRGVMTEAVRNLVAFLFDDYEVHRIVIRAAVENTRSRAIAERLGFTLEGDPARVAHPQRDADGRRGLLDARTGVASRRS